MGTTTLLERRFASEWQLLKELAERNPGRLTALQARGTVITLQLHGPDALPAAPSASHAAVHVHHVRIEFPVHFPSVPMELFLQTPVSHPNIHPETGFVCLWERHRVGNTVEHALHKLTAMLAGELRNTLPLHVMQPSAVDAGWHTAAMPLLGVVHQLGPQAPLPGGSARRRRLQ